jgi:hypothetical protein
MDIDTNKNIKEYKWVSNMICALGMIPSALKCLFIFAATAFVASAAANYINPTGLLCGVLAVLIYRQK